tara:strand:- start:299 stop:1444 length:1146 start_codon:yes stop_codon:yes gene_type:complete
MKKHRLNIYPEMKEEAFLSLRSDIEKNGYDFKFPIWIYENKIIDGWNRYKACNELGITPIYETFVGDELQAITFILRTNNRRDLTNYQRAVLSFEFEDFFRKIAQKSKAEKVSHFRNTGEVLATLPKSDTRKELSKVAQVGERTLDKVKKIQEKAPQEVKAKLATGEVSINAAYKEIKKEEKKEELQEKKKEYEKRIESNTNNEFKIDIFNTNETFRVIYADPAWSYNDKQDTPQLGGASKHYDTMSIAELSKLPVNKISEKNSILFLWVTSPLLEDAFKVVSSWGFKYKTSFIWDKVKHNMGHYNSVRHEILLVCTKGSCTPDNKVLYNSVQRIERNNNHSEKPIEFLNIIDELYNYGNKLEMFCRTIKKEKWYGWGNEL